MSVRPSLGFVRVECVSTVLVHSVVSVLRVRPGIQRTIVVRTGMSVRRMMSVRMVGVLILMEATTAAATMATYPVRIANSA